MIRKVGDAYELVSPHTGKVLGRHRSREDAQKQEEAINISKARQAGHNIPRKHKK